MKRMSKSQSERFVLAMEAIATGLTEKKEEEAAQSAAEKHHDEIISIRNERHRDLMNTMSPGLQADAVNAKWFGGVQGRRLEFLENKTKGKRPSLQSSK